MTQPRAKTEIQLRPLAFLTFAIATLSLLADVIGILTGYEQALPRFASLWTFVSQGAVAPFLQPQLWPLQLVFYVAISTITFYEWREDRIPLEVTVPGILVGFGMTVGFRQVSVLSALIGIAVGYLMPAAVSYLWFKLRGVYGYGLGVSFMLAMIGAFLGWEGMLVTFFITTQIAGLYGIYLLIRGGRAALQATFEIGPIIALSALLYTVLPLSTWFG